MVNSTMETFGYPGTLIAEFEHWVLLLRPAQVTLGSLVLVSRGEARQFGSLPAPAFTELGVVVPQIEAMLADVIQYEKINYLMLMMVDPHVHFHIFPRYDGERSCGGLTIADAGWPGPPDLKSGKALDANLIGDLRAALQVRFR